MKPNNDMKLGTIITWYAQKSKIALTLSREAKIILLDELFLELDPMARKECH